MRKDKLIELLNSLPGNPDILLWNGYFEDWMEIDDELVPTLFGKETVEHQLKMIVSQEETYFKKELTPKQISEIRKMVEARTKRTKLDMLNPYVEEKEHKEWYGNSIRTKYILNSKIKGVSSFDRLGDISY